MSAAANCGTCQDWGPNERPSADAQHHDAKVGACWSADRLDGDLSKGPASQTFNFERCEAHRPHTERSRKLDLIYKAMHRDYKGPLRGERSILMLREGGTCLVLLRNLTDAEIEKRLPAAARAS